MTAVQSLGADGSERTLTADTAEQVTPVRRIKWTASFSPGVGLIFALPALLLVLGFALIPVLSIVGEVFADLGSFFDKMTDPITVQAFWRTTLMSFMVTIGAVACGLALAWCLVRIKAPVVRLFLWLAVMAPFLMSVVVKNYTFVALLQDNGPVARLLEPFGISLAGFLYAEPAVILGMLYAMIPYAVLPIFAAVKGLDKSLVTAAETLGAGRLRTVTGIVLPLLARNLISTASLVFVICIGFYVTPVVLGGPTAPFAATLISSDLFEYFDTAGANAVAVGLLIEAAVVVVVLQIASAFLPSTKGGSR